MTAFFVWLASLFFPVAPLSNVDAKSAAAVAVAYAIVAPSSGEPTPPPPPGPKPKPECCGDCRGTGFVTHGDGHKTPCPCPKTCPCKGGK